LGWDPQLDTGIIKEQKAESEYLDRIISEMYCSSSLIGHCMKESPKSDV